MKRIVIALAFFLAFTQPAWCGVYFESEIHSSIEPDIHKSVTYISGTQMKTVIDDTYGWIIDLKAAKIYDFDLRAGTYFEMPIEGMSKELDELGEKMKVYEELYTLTEEQKENLKNDPEDMMFFEEGQAKLGKESQIPFKPVLKKVKKKRKILNYNCSLVQVDLSPTERGEFWVTGEIPFALEVMNFWKAFYRISSGSITKFDPLKKHFEVMSQLDGFALSRKTAIRAGGGAFEEEENVVLIEDRQFAKDTFELPKGMKRVELTKGFAS